MMWRFNKSNRRVVLTFLAAGAAAVVGEHMLKPSLKRKLKV